MSEPVTRMVKTLMQAKDWPPGEDLDDVFALGTTAIDPLRDAVKASLAKPDSVPNAFIAIGLLGDLKAEAAITELIQVLRCPDEELMGWALEALSSIGRAATEPLFALLSDTKAGGYGRCIAMYVLERFGYADAATRERLEGSLCTVLESLTSKGKKATENEQLVAGTAIGRLSEMRSQRARPLIEAAFAAHVADLDLTDPETVQEAYTRTGAPEQPQPETFREYYRKMRAFELEADGYEGSTDLDEVLPD